MSEEKKVKLKDGTDVTLHPVEGEYRGASWADVLVDDPLPAGWLSVLAAEEAGISGRFREVEEGLEMVMKEQEIRGELLVEVLAEIRNAIDAQARRLAKIEAHLGLNN